MAGPNKINVDAPKVTEDEARELMIYHLQMAACYYEAAGPDKLIIEEIDRTAEQRAKNASKAYATAIAEYYWELKQEQGDADEDE